MMKAKRARSPEKNRFPRSGHFTILLLLSGFLFSGAAIRAEVKNRIQSVTVQEQGGKTVVDIQGTARPSFTAFKLSSPSRLVIDVADSQLQGVPSIIQTRTALIEGVGSSQYEGNGTTISRVLINFREEAAYRVKVSGNSLIVTLTGQPSTGVTVQTSSGVSSGNAAALAEREGEALKRVQAAEEKARAAEAQKATAEEAFRKAEDGRQRIEEESKAAEKSLSDMSTKKSEMEAALVGLLEEKKQAEIALGRVKNALRGAEIARAAEEAKSKEIAEARSHEETLLKEIEEARVKTESAIEGAAKARAQADLKSHEQERDRLKERIAAAEQQLEEMKSHVKDREKELETSREILKNQEVKVDEAIRLRQEKEKELSSAEKLVKEERIRTQAAETQTRRALEEKNRLEQELTAIRTAHARSLEEKVKLQKDLDVARNEAAKVKIIEEQLSSVQVSNKEERQRIKQDLEQAKKQAARVMELEKALAGIDRLEQEKKALEDKLAVLQQGVEEKDRVKKELEKVRLDYAKSLEEKARLEKALEAARRQASSAQDIEKQRQELEKALSGIERMEKEKKALEEKLAALQKAGETQQAKSDAEAASRGPQVKQRQLAVGRNRGGATASRGGAKTSQIQDIRFENNKEIQKIVVLSTQPLEYSLIKDDDGNAMMEIRGVSLSSRLERTLDVTDFNGPVRTISSYIRENGGGAAIEVDIIGRSENTVRRTPDGLVWEFRASEPPAPAPNVASLSDGEAVKPKGTAARTVSREDPKEYRYLNEQTSSFVHASYRQDDVGSDASEGGKSVFRGRRIDLDFKDADIHNILRLLADVGHVNVITSDEVSGSVTIRMSNVPWDQALDVILRTKHLGMVREGNLIRVAPLSTLEKEREMELARRKQRQMMLPLETRLIPISYAEASSLQDKARSLMTARGNLSMDERTNTLIIRDTIDALNQIEALIRNLDTQTPQVLIEGRIVEATSTFSREIGIQWGGDFTASPATGNPTGLAFPSLVSVAGGTTDGQTPTSGLSPKATGTPNPNFVVNMPAPTGLNEGSALGVTLGSLSNNVNLSIRLSAMEDSGVVRILSSPRILTMDNKAASIEQGTMLPYSRVSAQGVQTQFKEAKLGLQVTPHVTADGSIMLKLTIQRDEPDFNNTGAQGDPAIQKRSANTELLVNDGSTAVIGGIYTRNTGESWNKVPGLGDIPILGWLFKTKNNADRRTEMMIFITPSIVNRAESIGK